MNQRSSDYAPDYSTPLAQRGYPLIRSVTLEEFPDLPIVGPSEEDAQREPSATRWVSSWSGDSWGSHGGSESFSPRAIAPAPEMPRMMLLDAIRDLSTRSGKLTAVMDAAARYFAEANQNASASYLAQGQTGTGALGEPWFLHLWLMRAHVYSQMLYWTTGDQRWDLISDDYLQVYSLVSGGTDSVEQGKGP